MSTTLASRPVRNTVGLNLIPGPSGFKNVNGVCQSCLKPNCADGEMPIFKLRVVDRLERIYTAENTTDIVQRDINWFNDFKASIEGLPDDFSRLTVQQISSILC